MCHQWDINPLIAPDAAHVALEDLPFLLHLLFMRTLRLVEATRGLGKSTAVDLEIRRGRLGSLAR